MKNKRGISNLVIILVVIVLAIVALGIISAVVFKMINKTEFSPGVDCLVLQTSQSIRIENACVEDNFLKVRVNRNGEGLNVNRIFFIVRGENEESKWCCGEDCGSCSLVEGNKNYEIDISGIGEANRIILESKGCIFDESEIGIC